MVVSDSARIAKFEHGHAKAQASEVLDLDWGYALLQRGFPQSHYHNRIAVTEPATATEVLTKAEAVLGGAGLRHRYISVHDDLLGQALTTELVAAGYEAETIVTMIYRGSQPEDPGHHVQEVSLDRLRPAIIRDWKFDLPDASDDQLGQLADRTSLYERGAEVTLLAVFQGEEIVARADLYIDATEQIAQFENLFTHPAYRRRGYGEALVRDALRRGSLAGCQISFLTADFQDWPLNWYIRRGYERVDTSHHFSRVPPGPEN